MFLPVRYSVKETYRIISFEFTFPTFPVMYYLKFVLNRNKKKCVYFIFLQGFLVTHIGGKHQSKFLNGVAIFVCDHINSEIAVEIEDRDELKYFGLN